MNQRYLDSFSAFAAGFGMAILVVLSSDGVPWWKMAVTAGFVAANLFFVWIGWKRSASQAVEES